MAEVPRRTNYRFLFDFLESERATDGASALAGVFVSDFVSDFDSVFGSDLVSDFDSVLLSALSLLPPSLAGRDEPLLA